VDRYPIAVDGERRHAADVSPDLGLRVVATPTHLIVNEKQILSYDSLNITFNSVAKQVTKCFYTNFISG
jgi:hypothetical protein